MSVSGGERARGGDPHAQPRVWPGGPALRARRRRSVRLGRARGPLRPRAWRRSRLRTLRGDAEMARAGDGIVDERGQGAVRTSPLARGRALVEHGGEQRMGERPRRRPLERSRLPRAPARARDLRPLRREGGRESGAPRRHDQERRSARRRKPGEPSVDEPSSASGRRRGRAGSPLPRRDRATRASASAKNGFPPEASCRRRSVGRANTRPSCRCRMPCSAPALSGPTRRRVVRLLVERTLSSDAASRHPSRRVRRMRMFSSSSRLSANASAPADDGIQPLDVVDRDQDRLAIGEQLQRVRTATARVRKSTGSARRPGRAARPRARAAAGRRQLGQRPRRARPRAGLPGPRGRLRARPRQAETRGRAALAPAPARPRRARASTCRSRPRPPGRAPPAPAQPCGRGSRRAPPAPRPGRRSRLSSPAGHRDTADGERVSLEREPVRAQPVALGARLRRPIIPGVRRTLWLFAGLALVASLDDRPRARPPARSARPEGRSSSSTPRSRPTSRVPGSATTCTRRASC